MTTVNDTINIALGLQDKGNTVSAKEKDFDKLDTKVNKSLASIKALSKELEKLGKAGAIVDSVISSNLNTAKARGGLAAGTPKAAANNAYTQGVINTANGSDLATQSKIINNNETISKQMKRSIQNYEIQQLSLVRQRKLSDDIVMLKKQEAAQGMRLVEVQAQIILRQEQGRIVTKKMQADLEVERNLYNAINQKILNIETATKQRLKDEREIARLAAQAAKPVKPAVAAKTDADIRARKEQLLLGDGGASLFKVQAGLLVNYAVMSQIFNLFQFGTQYVVKFDAALRELQAVTVSSDGDIKSLSKTFVDLSQNTKFSAVQIAEAAVTLGQAGLSTKQIQDSIGAVSLLATASGSDLATSTDVVTSALTVFNLTGDQTAHIADVMTNALNLSKLTMDKLQLGLQYVGNTAAEAGLSLEETTASLATLSNAGIKSGSTLGTGLAKLLTDLQAPSKKFTDQLEKLKIPLSAIDVKANGLTGVLENLKKAGFSATDAFKSLDLRAAKTYIALAKSTDGTRAYEVALQASGAAAKANETQLRSLENSFLRFQNTLGATILQIGEPIKNVFITLVNGVSGFLAVLNQIPLLLPVIGSAFLLLFSAAVIVRVATLTGNLLGMTGALASVGPASVVAAAGIEGVAVASTQAATSVGLFSKALTFLFRTPIGLVFTGLALLTGALLGYNALTGDAANATEQLSNRLSKSKAAYDETETRIQSVNSEIERLTSRHASLSKNSRELQAEIINANSKFKGFANGLRFDVVNSADELIKKLRELKKELQGIALQKLENQLADQGALAKNELNKLRDDFAKKEEAKAELAKMIKGSSYAGEINSQMAGNDSFYNGLFKNIYDKQPKFNSKPEDLAAVNDDYKKVADQLNARREQLNILEENAQRLQDAGLKNKLKDIQSEKALNEKLSVANDDRYARAFDAEKLAAARLDKKISDDALIAKRDDEIQAAASALKDAEAENDKTKIVELRKTLEKLTTISAEQIQEIAKNTGATVEEVKAYIRDNISPAALSLVSDAKNAYDEEAERKKAEKAERERLRKEREAERAYNKKLKEERSEQKIRLSELEREESTSPTKLASDRQVSKLGTLISQASDTTYGGLRGIYSDAEIKAFEKQKRALEDGQVSEQLNVKRQQTPLFQSIYDKAKMDKERVWNDDNSTYDQQEKSLSNLNEAEDKLIENKQKIAELENEEAARAGVLLQGHTSVIKQISDTIAEYQKQMVIQDDLGLNIDKNLTETFDNARSSFKDFIKDFVSGNKTAGEAFGSFAEGVMEKLIDMAATAATNQVFNGILGFATKAIGAYSGGAGAGYSSAIGPTQVANSSGFYGMNAGGSVKRAAAGTAVNTRDGQPILARQGEYVLRNSAVDMIGKGNLDALNAMGNRKVSNSAGGMAAMAAPQPAPPVNVYVVQEGKKPTLTKTDVLVTIQDDIARGGNTMKLIKQIGR